MCQQMIQLVENFDDDDDGDYYLNVFYDVCDYMAMNGRMTDE